MDTQTRNQAFYSPNDLQNVLRHLWLQNIYWTRSLMISIFSNLKDVDVIANRLLQNPIDFSNVLRIYYGEETADKFENLLRNNLKLAIQYVNTYAVSQKSGNAYLLNSIEKQWYDNASNLAAFLSGINPYWNKQILEEAFYNQIDMLKDEIYKRYYGQYAMEVDAFDYLEYHTLMIAEIMINGLLKQFY